ncbi:MAG: rod shape-determining protein RodA [Candidatus Limnocylindrales bacterium]
MSTIDARPSPATDWGARSIGTVWRAFDLQIATYAVLLTGFGLAMAYSNTVAGGAEVLAPGSVFLRGLLWTSIALTAFVLATAFDYRWLKTFAWPLYALQLGLLGSTLAFGSGVGGSSRWVSLLGLQFQFSELAKILMIVILANYMASRQGRMGSLWSILGACALTAPPLVLVLLQPDLGTSLVFAAVLVGMLFISGASLRWLGALALAVVAALPFIWTYVLRDYQKERLTSFLDPLADIRGAGYQLYQSQIAVGSGGWFGKGLTNSTQNQLDFLPVQTTDFVFAILAEELGFIGAMVVIGLFMALIWRVIAAGWRSRDPFGRLFAVGIGSMVLFQLFVNIGMVIGIMPITGIPLPFITHGGASLVSIAVGLGILESINIRQGRAEW